MGNKYAKSWLLLISLLMVLFIIAVPSYRSMEIKIVKIIALNVTIILHIVFLYYNKKAVAIYLKLVIPFILIGIIMYCFVTKR